MTVDLSAGAVKPVVLDVFARAIQSAGQQPEKVLAYWRKTGLLAAWDPASFQEACDERFRLFGNLQKRLDTSGNPDVYDEDVSPEDDPDMFETAGAWFLFDLCGT